MKTPIKSDTERGAVDQQRLVVLLPCPFCNDATAKPYVALYDEDAPNRRQWGFVVRCPHCESQGPRFGTCEDAEEAWNTRPKPKRQLICGWRGMAGGKGCILPLGHGGGHGFSDGSGIQHNVSHQRHLPAETTPQSSKPCGG